MKIIKIELQNINSLKCNTPIVIDFESEAFRDVGLYAITGPTGAGKTTILDAITIAMYHSVPRFNKSNIKAGLEDVVSHGAAEALSRVTFDTKGTRYEAQWSMRLVAKNGNRLSTPKEEVRLKNITLSTIIAEKKREVQSEVERITQLSYDQFLRSVMLAQGEFAAFLSANASEKGTLLEQITGEDIYKKIGETLSDKIAAERKILDAIRAKINTEDLLSDELRKELLEEESALNIKIKLLEIEFKEVERIINWFKKELELASNRQLLETRRIELVKEKETRESILQLLEQHEKAEPFKEAITELIRLEKELDRKKLRSAELSKELKEIEDKLKEYSKKEEVLKIAHSQSELEFTEWLPKLEEVTKLDAERANLSKRIAEFNLKNKELIAQLDKLSIDKNQKNEQLKLNEITLAKIDAFLAEHKNVSEIEKKFNSWNSSLSLRKNNYKRLSELAANIALADKEQLLTKTNIDKTKTLFAEEDKNLKLSKDEVKRLESLLIENNLDKLLLQNRQIEIQRSRLKELKDASLFYKDLTIANAKQIAERNELNDFEKKFSAEILKVQADLLVAQNALKDAETILDLERVVQSFEEERKKLEPGKPCSLCGSTDHPFVEKYENLELSKTKAEVEKRKAALESLNKKEKDWAIQLGNIKTKLENNTSQSKSTSEQLNETKTKFDGYESKFQISDLEIIGAEIEGIQKESELISGKIKTAQKIQLQKNEQDKIANNHQKKVSDISIELARLQEKIEGIVTGIQQKKTEQKNLRLEIEEMEIVVVKELSAFDLELPDPQETAEFIARLEKGIQQFQQAKEKRTEVKNTLEKLAAELKTIDLQQTEKGEEMVKRKEEIEKGDVLLAQITERRKLILPIETSTENKRSALRKAVETAKVESEKTTAECNRLKTLLATRNQEHQNLEKEQTTELDSLKTKSVTLNTEITFTIFKSRHEVEKALLGIDEKTNYLGIRKKLDDKTLELKTLETKLGEDLGKLSSEKNFEVSHEQTKEKQAELEFQREQLLKRMGEIKKQFELDQQIKERNQGVVNEIMVQDKILAKWINLMKLLGGSKQAFNTYVQRLTLQNLINLANVHLYKLNKRYSLKMLDSYKTGEELNFMLMDHYQTDETRLVDTSSGGEKFLISLALALGLSDLASKNVQIGSLFIDEGFGSLDNDSMETVISTLQTLQSQGKMIGIISHVENMKERIPTQIQVIKKSNGVSEVVIV